MIPGLTQGGVKRCSRENAPIDDRNACQLVSLYVSVRIEQFNKSTLEKQQMGCINGCLAIACADCMSQNYFVESQLIVTALALTADGCSIKQFVRIWLHIQEIPTLVITIS